MWIFLNNAIMKTCSWYVNELCFHDNCKIRNKNAFIDQTVCRLFCAFSYRNVYIIYVSPVLFCERKGKTLDLLIRYAPMRKRIWCFGSGNSGKGTTCVLVLSSTPGQRAVSDSVNEPVFSTIFKPWITPTAFHSVLIRYECRPGFLSSHSWLIPVPGYYDKASLQ